MNIAGMNRDFIVAAFAVTWIVVLGYFSRLVAKGSAVSAEYDRMSGKASGSPK